MCQISIAPVSESTASSPTATARRRSDASMMRRRSNRSLATPPTSRKTIVGTVMAMPTSDIAVAVSDSS